LGFSYPRRGFKSHREHSIHSSLFGAIGRSTIQINLNTKKFNHIYCSRSIAAIISGCRPDDLGSTPSGDVMKPVFILIMWIALIVADVGIGLRIIGTVIDSPAKMIAGISMIAIILGSMWITSGLIGKAFDEEERAAEKPPAEPDKTEQNA
jgi:hypothetical protein